MNETKPTVYKKHRDKNIKYTKSLDKRNKTIHEYDIDIATTYHFRISEPTIRKCYMIVGFIFGVIIHIVYIKNNDLVSKYIISIKNFLFNITPFARNILKNNNFEYVFNIGIFFTLLISIAFFFIMWSELEKIIPSLIFTFIFLFVYLYLNFGICHLIIKIPIYYKILSAFAITISNIIAGIVCCALELLILE